MHQKPDNGKPLYVSYVLSSGFELCTETTSGMLCIKGIHPIEAVREAGNGCLRGLSPGAGTKKWKGGRGIKSPGST
jgi:hypothetical protein